MDNHHPADPRQAFAAAYDAHAKRIYDYLYYRLRHRETAEDLAAVTFTKAWQHFADFDERKGTVQSWLYRIARNCLIDHWRKQRPTVDVEDFWDLLPGTDDVNANAEARERLAEVDAFLASLPARQRDIVVLRVWDGLTHAEVAEVVGLSEAAAKMSFSRTIRQLRDKLGPTAVLLLLFSSR
jgi:RNA polymerase sigma-70 factor (ECF subfamily)